MKQKVNMTKKGNCKDINLFPTQLLMPFYVFEKKQ